MVEKKFLSYFKLHFGELGNTFDHTLKASEKFHSFYSEIYFFAKFAKQATISIYFLISIH